MQVTNMKMIKRGIIIGLIMISLVTIVFAGETALFPVNPGTRSTSPSSTDFGSGKVITDEGLVPNIVASYKHNQTIWASSGAVQIQEQSLYRVPWKNHYTNGFLVNINKSSTIFVNTHFTHPFKIDGVKTKVRYFWSRINLPKNVNVTHIDICTGDNILKQDDSIKWVGDGIMKDYIYDMGAWYEMQRGIEIAFHVRNDDATNAQSVKFYGSGARIEW